jgi:mannose-6-phosphate isomerase-like protein (cupin superfamily)
MSDPSTRAAAINRFVAAAADAYRATGNPRAIELAGMLSEHRNGTYPIEVGRPALTKHLDAVLAAADLHPVARALGSAIKELNWANTRFVMPPSFQGKYIALTLIGEGTTAPDERFYFGLFLQEPNSYYPSHWHRAEELYYVLSGTALWQQGETKLTPKPPGTFIHHAPDEPHIMQTHDAPLLAMWAWIGDLSPGTYRIVGV